MVSESTSLESKGKKTQNRKQKDKRQKANRYAKPKSCAHNRNPEEIILYTICLRGDVRNRKVGAPGINAAKSVEKIASLLEDDETRGLVTPRVGCRTAARSCGARP